MQTGLDTFLSPNGISEVGHSGSGAVSIEFLDILPIIITYKNAAKIKHALFAGLLIVPISN